MTVIQMLRENRGSVFAHRCFKTGKVFLMDLKKKTRIYSQIVKAHTHLHLQVTVSTVHAG